MAVGTTQSGALDFDGAEYLSLCEKLKRKMHFILIFVICALLLIMQVGKRGYIERCLKCYVLVLSFIFIVVDQFFFRGTVCSPDTEYILLYVVGQQLYPTFLPL